MAINIPAGGTSFTANGVAVGGINGNGALTRGVRPCAVCAIMASGLVAGGDIVFNNVPFNEGGYYNTTNGRFTAPVSGVYFVSFRCLLPYAAASSAYWFGLYINGVGYIGTASLKRNANMWMDGTFRTHVYLNAGDYVTLRYIAGAEALYTDSNYLHYCVVLVK